MTEDLALFRPDQLFTLAEIAIGLAGFSAIVVMFKRRDAGEWLPADADRFTGMVGHSMMAALFCFLPALLSVFLGSESALWGVGSALLGTQILLHSVLIVRLETTDLGGKLLTGVGGGAVVLLEAANVSGIGFSREFGPYLVGVLWHLIHAGVLFMSLVWVRGTVGRE